MTQRERKLRRLAAYVDGTLSDEGRARFEQDLERDGDLRYLLDVYQTLRSLAESGPEPRDSYPVEQYVADVMRRAESERTGTRFLPRIVWVGLPAAAALAIGFWGWRNPQPKTAAELVASAPPEVTRSAPEPATTAPSVTPQMAPATVPHEALQRAPQAAAKEAPNAAPKAAPEPTRAAPPAREEAEAFALAQVDEQIEAGRDVRTVPSFSAGGGARLAEPEAAPLAPVARARQNRSAAYPFELRIVAGDDVHVVKPVVDNLTAEFDDDGIHYSVTLKRSPDGQWTLATNYKPENADEATESAERFFRLPATGSAARTAANAAQTVSAASPESLRIRIAQPIGRAEKLYAVIVPTQ
ncbi:hypothetical protein FJZ36_03710 [Candidatus Poribacteria bacterium]|nr:hypothetical protein [Candidatus Poribacteria bacterium]